MSVARPQTAIPIGPWVHPWNNLRVRIILFPFPQLSPDSFSRLYFTKVHQFYPFLAILLVLDWIGRTFRNFYLICAQTYQTWTSLWWVRLQYKGWTFYCNYCMTDPCRHGCMACCQMLLCWPRNIPKEVNKVHDYPPKIFLVSVIHSPAVHTSGIICL